MTAHNGEADHWLPAAQARMSYLAEQIQRHSALVAASEGVSPTDYAGIMRAGIMLTDHRAELEAWHALLQFWQERHQRQPKEVPAQVAVLLTAGYFAIVLAILLYLVALAGR